MYNSCHPKFVVKYLSEKISPQMKFHKIDVRSASFRSTTTTRRPRPAWAATRSSCARWRRWRRPERWTSADSFTTGSSANGNETRHIGWDTYVAGLPGGMLPFQNCLFWNLKCWYRYFMSIRYTYIFFPFWMLYQEKIWQPWYVDGTAGIIYVASNRRVVFSRLMYDIKCPWLRPCVYCIFYA
jgi:hypothetical protein